MTEPTGGVTSPPVLLVCYEVAGSIREPELVLDLTLLRPGTRVPVDSRRVPGDIGRSATQVEFSAATPGSFDLRVQLIVNGSAIDGLAVLIEQVTLRRVAPPRACP